MTAAFYKPPRHPSPGDRCYRRSVTTGEWHFDPALADYQLAVADYTPQENAQLETAADRAMYKEMGILVGP